MPAAALIVAPTVDAALARPTTGRGRPEGDAALFAGLMEAPVETVAVARPVPPVGDTPQAPTTGPAPVEAEAPVGVEAADQTAEAQGAVVVALLIQPAPTPPPATPPVEAPTTGTKAAAPPVAPDTGAEAAPEAEQGQTAPTAAFAATKPADLVKAETTASPALATPTGDDAGPPSQPPVPSVQATTPQPAPAASVTPPQQALQALLARAAPPIPARGEAAPAQTVTEDPDAVTAAAASTEETVETPAASFRAVPAPAPAPAGTNAATHPARSAPTADTARGEGVARATGSLAAAQAAPAAEPAPAPAAPPVSAPPPTEVAARAEPAPVTTTSAAPAAPLVDAAPAVAARAAASGMSHAAIETTAQIAAQIVWRLEGRQTRFDMVLTPDDLGRVDVSIDIDSDGQLAARLAFDNPAAAADLRGRADELRRQLQDAGFQVAGDGLDFSEREGGASRGGSGDREASPAFARAARLSAAADAAIPATPVWASLSLTPDGVDVRV